MKSLMNFNEPISVVPNNSTVCDIIDNIVKPGNREYPFCVLNIDDIIYKFEKWKALMPRVNPHYAVKCNDHPLVLKILATLGTGFDCASKTEMDKVLSLNVDPSRIIYAHTTKPPSHIRHAVNLKINLMTFDNELELHKIKNLCPSVKTVIRIKHDAKVAHCKLGDKFGCDPYKEAANLLRIAQELSIQVIGASFHVGSGCKDAMAYRGAIEAARYVFDISNLMGYNFNLLDIGGGYPGDEGTSLDEYANTINVALDEFFPDPSITVISEPGTYFVASAFTLACSIHSAKKITNSDDASTKFAYYVNDGVFGSLSDIVHYNITKIPKPLKNYSDSKLYLSTVWGPTCDSLDHIISDILLPEMQLGDWFFVSDMGAYTLPLCTTFNGFESPEVYSIISEKSWMLMKMKASFTNLDFSTYYIGNIIKEQEISYNFPEADFQRG